MTAVKPNGATHWIRFLPNHVYCFVPSDNKGDGILRKFKSMPEVAKQFKYCMEIQPVNYLYYVNLFQIILLLR